MATSTAPSTKPLVQTSSSFYAQSFSTLALQSLQAQRAAKNAAQQQAAAAQQVAAQKQSVANAQRIAHRQNFATNFTTTAPSFLSVGPPSTLNTPPPKSITTSTPTGKVQPTTPVPTNPVPSPKPQEKSWSFDSCLSITSNDAEEELILQPNLAKVSSTRISSQADATSILKGAFGDKMVTGKPMKVQDSSAAMQQRAAMRQDAPPSILHGLLINRCGKQKIFLMRHGESEGNVSRFDVADPNLTQVGLMQAKSWQETVGDFGAEIVLVSPLRRTIQTATHAFCNEQVPFLLCRSAREFGWGCAENTISLEQNTMDEMLSDLPHGDEIQGIHEALYPGLDDPMDEYESLDRLKFVLASRPENVIMVVCHYGVISALTGNRAKNGDVYECNWGGDDELKVVARHRNPLSDQTCLCG